MFKQSLVLTAVLSILIVGCSSDKQYQREVQGNQDYLQSPEMRALIVPNGLKVPPQNSDFYINKAAKEGLVGLQVDIRPPALPLAIVADSYASYQNGSVIVDIPEYALFWAHIPTILANHNIAIEQSNEQLLKTATYSIKQDDLKPSIDATYLLQREIRNSREYITISLTSLNSNGQNMLADATEHQRYTVDFYNMLINDLPISNQTTPE